MAHRSRSRSCRRAHRPLRLPRPDSARRTLRSRTRTDILRTRTDCPTMPGRRRGWWRTVIEGATAIALGQSLQRRLRKVPSNASFLVIPAYHVTLVSDRPGLEFANFLPSLLPESADRGTRAPPAAASRRKAAALDERPDYSARLPRLSSVSCTECSLSLSTRPVCARRSASRLRRVRRVQRPPPTSVSPPYSLLHALGEGEGTFSSSA